MSTVFHSFLLRLKLLLKVNRNLIIIQIFLSLLTLFISLWMVLQMINRTNLYLSFTNTGWEGERTSYKVTINNSGSDVAKDVQIIVMIPDSLEPDFTCIGYQGTYVIYHVKGYNHFFWRLPENPLYIPATRKEPYSIALEPKIEIRPAAIQREISDIEIEYYINHSKGSIHKYTHLKIPQH
jgi:hypothetical protein